MAYLHLTHYGYDVGGYNDDAWAILLGRPANSQDNEHAGFPMECDRYNTELLAGLSMHDDQVSESEHNEILRAICRR